MAEIVDDEDDDFPPALPQSKPKSRPQPAASSRRPDPPKPKRPEPSQAPELSLSELAGLDSDDSPAAPEAGPASAVFVFGVSFPAQLEPVAVGSSTFLAGALRGGRGR